MDDPQLEELPNIMGDVEQHWVGSPGNERLFWFGKSIKGTSDLREHDPNDEDNSNLTHQCKSKLNINSANNTQTKPKCSITDEKEQEDTNDENKINNSNNSTHNSTDSIIEVTPKLTESQSNKLSKAFSVKHATNINNNKKNTKTITVTNKINKTVFISIKVKTLLSIQNVDQTFRMRFHMYCNWLPTLSECLEYAEYKTQKKLKEWEPQWYPHLEFVNAVEEHKVEWETYPFGGKFRMEKFEDFGCTDPTDDANGFMTNIMPEGADGNIFDSDNARFIRAKLVCDVTFAEIFELGNFPLDCQDLTCVIEERSKDIVCKFMPELRNENFVSIKQRFSVINEWKLKNVILELGKRTMGRTNQHHPVIELRLKVERKWSAYFWRIIVFMIFICFMALTAYSIDYGDLGDKLGLIITAVLTIVAFQILIDEQIPIVPYLTFLEKYILWCYIFTIIIMIQTAITGYVERDEEDEIEDGHWFWICFGLLFVIHIYFIVRGFYARIEEKRKLYQRSYELTHEKKVLNSEKGFKLKYDRDVIYKDNEWRKKCLEYCANEKSADSITARTQFMEIVEDVIGYLGCVVQWCSDGLSGCLRCRNGAQFELVMNHA